LSRPSSTASPDRPASPRRLTGEDAIFLYAETPSMPMHTVGTMILDPSVVPGGFGFPEIARTVASHIHRMPPFRQRLLQVPLGLGHPLMADDPDFRLERHLHRLAVPAPGGLRELAEVVGDLAGRLLDRSQPLWEMWAVEGLEGGRIALVMKMHHCIIDGASGSSQMAGLLDLEPGAAPPEPPAEGWNPPSLPSPLVIAARSLGSRVVGPLSLGRLALDTARGLRQRRRTQRDRALARGERSPLLDLPPETPFNRAISPYRRVAYGSAPLADVKRIKNAFGVTVNDAVLAACSLALRGYLQARYALPERPIHCAVPVSLKSQREKQEYSNKVSMMVVRLPTHLSDPGAVLRAIEAETEDAKQVFQSVEANLLQPWLQLVPPLLTSWGTRLFSDLDVADHVPPIVNCIVSNMMGPPIPLYFGGARVEAVYPMGPIGEGMGVNITVLSNMGRLDVGVLTCREIVPDPSEITAGFASAIDALLRAAEKRERSRRAAAAASTA
jgi:diacylglycerol O-acyltransferase